MHARHWRLWSALLATLALLTAAPGHAHAVADERTPALTIQLTRTDALGDDVHVGDRLTFDISYTNHTSSPVTAYPRTSSLANTAVEGDAGHCRWAKLAPGDTKTCSGLAYHVATAEDVAAGFTPRVVFDATRDRAGTDVVEAGIVGSLAAIPVSAAARPHPSEVTHELGEGEARTLAESGLAGYACHRIPALTTAANGWIIAAWDGRPGSCQDAPQANSIIGRISKDGGKTWTTPITLAAGHPGPDKVGYSDPSLLVDRETGTIFLFSVKSFDQGILNSVAGTDPHNRGVLHAAVTESRDNGLTWSTPRVITADITSDPAAEHGRFASSGEGIQLRYGPHAGRLVQQYAVNYATGRLAMKSVSVYSDDHGATWHAGEAFGTGMDENKVVELSDGTLMVNSRASDATRARKVALSSDGGATYGAVRVESALPDPHNNASIIRAFPNAAENSRCAKILLFSNAHSTSSRVNGTVRVSYDDGRTWSSGRVFEPGSLQYSTLTALPQAGTYGLLYEHVADGGIQINYMTISMDWLGQDTGCAVADAGTQTESTATDAGTQTDSTATDPGSPTASTAADADTQTDSTAPDPGSPTASTAADADTQTDSTAPDPGSPTASAVADADAPVSGHEASAGGSAAHSSERAETRSIDAAAPGTTAARRPLAATGAPAAALGCAGLALAAAGACLVRRRARR